MKRCPNCNSELTIKPKRKEGFILLAIAVIVLFIDLLMGTFSVFLYGTIVVLCLYYFFSKGRKVYICRTCFSEFHDISDNNHED